MQSQRPIREPPISIHALREEGDCQRPKNLGRSYKFLSTPSARRATPDASGADRKDENFYPRPPRGGRPGAEQGLALHSVISIHALREEGDPS